MEPPLAPEVVAHLPIAHGLPESGPYKTHARPEPGRLMKALGLDITYLRAEGDYLEYEHQGERRRVVDLLGGFGATLFGHHHPALVAALTTALAERAPVMAQASWRAWAGELAKALSERIAATTGADYVVTLTNTGAEAIEAAIKHAELERFEAAEEAARRFRRRSVALCAEHGEDQAAFLRESARELGHAALSDVAGALEAIAQANARARATAPVFFALERAFHGKTSGASQLTYNPAYREPFSRIGVRCEFLPLGDREAWERAIARATVRTWDVALRDGRLVLVEKPFVNVSAILVEPLQGEGGIHPLEAEDAALIRQIADAHGIPVVVDEIQSGMGRTGEFLASTAIGLRGDYYAFAKSLGGGLVKIGALAVDRARYRQDFGLLHTSTFAEDDLSCRVALRALALLDEADVPGRCRALGARFLAKLQALVERHPEVLRAARGRGLMLGLEFRPQAESPSNVIRMLADHGYLGYAIAGYLLHEEGFRVAPTLSAAAVIRLEPSAWIPEAELDRFVAAVDRLATILERGNAYRLIRHAVGEARAGDPTPVADYRRSPRRLRREPPRCEKRVAFIGHFITAREALLWDPSLAELPEGALERFQLATHRIFGPTLYDQLHVTSAIGETVHLTTIGINLTSKAIEAAMRSRETGWLAELVDEAVAKARAAGCQVVGLGGYTSIVTDNGRRVTERGVTLTTGNALTAGMGMAALRQGAAAQGIALSAATLGVVGAAGNIGAVYAEMMAEEVGRLVLVGRENNPRLAHVAARIYESALARAARGDLGGIARAIATTRVAADWPTRPPEERTSEALVAAFAAELGAAAPVVVTEDLGRLRECRLIVTASNSARPLVHPEHLGPEPLVICDIAVPEDVAPEVESARPDALVIRGGLVAVPHDPEFRIAAVPLPDGQSFACMGETLLLGLMGVRDHFSYGPLAPAQVRQAMAWAALNGFELGGYKRERSY